MFVTGKDFSRNQKVIQLSFLETEQDTYVFGEEICISILF